MFAWLKNLFSGGEEEKAPPRDVTLTTLGVGDVVIHFGTTYLVEQRITYHQQGFFWFDYRLEDGESGTKAWLSVADDDELEVAFFHPIDLVVDVPPPQVIEHEGTLYRQVESGQVDAKIDRGTGSETRTVVDAWDFEAEDGQLLGVQRWGEDEIEVAAGRSIQPIEVDLLPGS